MKRPFLFVLALALGLPVSQATAQAPNAWINELHYDNDGADTGEFVEIVIETPGDFTLSDFSIAPYNGNDGASYSVTAGADFDASSTSGDFAIYAYNIDGLQNGAPDGVALCYQGSPVSSGSQTQFLSYEGTFTASGGCADDITSTDIGVQEHGNESIGQSVQLEGDGTSYADFAWAGPKADSPGQVNDAQMIGSMPSGPTVQFTSMGTTVNENDGSATLTASISNPNGSPLSMEIAFDTAISSAGGTDIDYYSTETVTFPAGATDGDTESVTVQLTDDSDPEGTEVATFILQNPTNASVGSPSSYDLTIQDDDLPNLAINEFLADPNGGMPLILTSTPTEPRIRRMNSSKSSIPAPHPLT